MYFNVVSRCVSKKKKKSFYAMYIMSNNDSFDLTDYLKKKQRKREKEKRKVRARDGTVTVSHSETSDASRAVQLNSPKKARMDSSVSTSALNSFI